MARQVVGIEKSVLRWARETAGLSPEAVAALLKLDAAKVRYGSVRQSKWLGALISWVAPALVFFQLKIDWRVLERMGDPRLLQVAHAARDATQPGDVLMIFGADWSSVIPYYSERRALMDRFIGRLPANPQAVEAVRRLAPARVGAGVYCAGARGDPGQMLQSILYLKLNPEPAFSNELCQIHLPQKAP